jgi:sporulation protein YlmC with PRC-barrel domain
MSKKINELYGNQLNASDGDIGSIEDFYFDDQSWNIRYLVAETGTWLDERQVLISPYSIERLDLEDEIVIVNLTRLQIENSPPIERHRPVSRQFETEYYTYYGWPYYWSGDGILGLGGHPITYSSPAYDPEVDAEKHMREDIHLRSTLDLVGYEIEASNGTIGRVTDFTVDDHAWAIKELVVEAGHWYSGKEVLIPVTRVNSISYDKSKICVNLTTEDIGRTSVDHNVQASRH